MNILEKIINAKHAELKVLKSNTPVALLEKSKYFQSRTRSLGKALTDIHKHGIIAEFKRRSPSKGVINSSALSEEVCPLYLDSGASAVSVLTDREFFGGCNEDLIKARMVCDGAILRKEFIIDEYQVVESKSIGADAILLIADILNKKELKNLYFLASSLKMEVLFEIHDESGIEKLPSGSGIIGINSRNLGNFNINMDVLNTTINLLPQESIKIAESGIHSAEALIELRKTGFAGFLIGELFMKNHNPGSACREFITDIKRRESLSSGEKSDKFL